MFLRRALTREPPGAASRLPDLGPAPELTGAHPWLNTEHGEPLRIDALSGRVVLLEFWTFACGNCVRTLPFLRQMYRRYRPGLEVVGVHTPELPFERQTRNVERAVRVRSLDFPVGLDNDYLAWNAFGNQYWPSLYLIDAAGHIRHAHVGEGGYRKTEAAIRSLLDEANGIERSPDAWAAKL